MSELAFQRYALITPHANPTNTSVFIVISGGGFVQVGDERARVNHGEAVLWPPGIVHGAYTDGTEMRAIIVELIGDAGDMGSEARAHAPMSAVDPGTEPGQAQPPTGSDTTTRTPPRGPTPAEGTLAERKVSRDDYDSSEGEPW